MNKKITVFPQAEGFIRALAPEPRKRLVQAIKALPAGDIKILEGALLQSTNSDLASDRFHEAIWFILGAFVFDFLDGRLARLV